MPQRIAWTHRAHERVTARFHAQACEDETRTFEVEMIDISQGGCAFRADEALDPGVRIWIAFHGLSALEAEIVWKTASGYGCRFVQPLHAAIFEHLRDRARQF